MVTYRGGERRHESNFEIQVDGQQLAKETLASGQTAKFYDVEYPVPKELAAGKDKITVRFQAADRSDIGPIFGLRTILRRREAFDVPTRL